MSSAIRPPLLLDPIAFPIFGLDETWTGPRWLEWVDFSINGMEPFERAVYGVTLGHGIDQDPYPGEPHVNVITALRERRLDRGTDDEVSPWAAHLALFNLVNMTKPKSSGKQAAAYDKASIGFIDDQSDQWQEWTLADWTIDDRPVQARIFEWAGAWTGFVLTRTEFVTVTGVDIPASALALRTKEDTSEYHFDVTERIIWPDTLTVASAAAPGQPHRRRWPRHPDHTAMLTRPARPAASTSTYCLRASARTNRRIDASSKTGPETDPALGPTSRASKIFGAAFERVTEPGRGWTLWMQRSASELDDDEYCRIDMPDGVPLARVRTEVLFDPTLPLDYELLRPEWSKT